MTLPLVIGHRGCAGLEPENTLHAFRRALALGADAIELDVRLTRDGVPVVFHDEKLRRLTDGHGRVCDFTLHQLRRFRIREGGARPLAAPLSAVDLRIPALDEVLQMASAPKQRRRGLGLIVELKEPGAPAPVIELIRRYNAETQTLLIAFDHDLLSEAQRLNPRIAVGALWNRPPRDACSRARNLGASVIDVSVRHVTARLVERAHAAGLKVYVWTANSPAQMRRMIRLGVDGVTTDFPDRLAALL